MHYFVTDRMHPCSFFAEAQRIVTEDYVPSMEDIRHASEPEKGIVETHLSHGVFSLRVLQVYYGQQDWWSFRKWIPLFEDVTNVMFSISLADYDEPGICSLGQQVCASSFVFDPDNMREHTSPRREWPNISLFSKKLSTRAGSCGRQSYYS